MSGRRNGVAHPAPPAPVTVRMPRQDGTYEEVPIEKAVETAVDMLDSTIREQRRIREKLHAVTLRMGSHRK